MGLMGAALVVALVVAQSLDKGVRGKIIELLHRYESR